MKKRYIFLVLAVLGLVLIPAGFVLAEDLLGDAGSLKSATDLCGPIRTLKRVINYGLAILGPAAVIVLIIGGIMKMIAGANEQMVRQSNAAIAGGIIGFIIVLLSWTIVTVVIASMGYAELSTSWFNVECPETETEGYVPPEEEEENSSAYGSGGGKCEPKVADSCTAQSCVWTNEVTKTVYHCQCNCNNSCNCDQFIDQASDTLKEGLTCMETEFAKRGWEPGFMMSDMSGIGDSGGKTGQKDYADCSGQAGGSGWSEADCWHSEGSAHYGCGSEKKSYAIDFGRASLANEEKYKAVARACGASEYWGPSHDTSKRDHQDHIHIGFCESKGNSGW